jgi:hypothetical protein
VVTMPSSLPDASGETRRPCDRNCNDHVPGGSMT